MPSEVVVGKRGRLSLMNGEGGGVVALGVEDAFRAGVNVWRRDNLERRGRERRRRYIMFGNYGR